MVRLLFEDKDYAKALAGLARESVICDSCDWDEAGGLLANAVERAETPEARRLLVGQFVTARNSESMTDLHLAEIACNKALEIDPDDADAHFKKGRIEEGFWNPEQAAANYSDAVRLDPSHWNAWGALAWVHHRFLHNTEDAEDAYLKALKINPEAWWIRTNYGTFLQEETDRFLEAEQEFRKVCENDPEPARAWFNLGNLLKSFLNRPDEAEKAYTQSIAEDNEYGPPVMGLALLYRDLGKEPTSYRPLALRAMSLPPFRGYDIMGFLSLCGDDSGSIQNVLPALCRWCAKHRQHVDLPMVYNLSFTMWMRLSDLIGPGSVLEFMQTVPETDLEPFEAIGDVFRAMSDPSHVHRLAPERARFVTEVLERKTGNGKK